MSENTENKKNHKVWLPITCGVVGFGLALTWAVLVSEHTVNRCRNSDKLKSEQVNNQAIQTEIAEQQYILNVNKLNAIHNELRRANELQALRLKQDSIQTELARRQYMLDSVRFAAQQHKK